MVAELVVVLTAFRLVTVCLCGMVKERDGSSLDGLDGVIESEYCTNG